MADQLAVFPSTNWGRRWLLVVCMTLLLALIPMSQPMSAALHAAPDLLAWATEYPDSIVTVIVQKAATDTRVEAAVADLGGTVTKDLHIIHAFAAELPARAVQHLAQMSGVRWISRDSPAVKSGGPDGSVNTGNLLSVYNQAIGADKLWAQGYQGSSVAVAVVDSGWTNHEDFRATPTGGNMRLLRRVGFNTNATNLDDHYGHAAHIFGIIGGNGRKSQGAYMGVAPKAKLISVKVCDDNGMASVSDVVNGLQWINDNRATYNIRVVNLSLNSSTAQSYNVDPLNAAVEILWFNKIVVVVSAGNQGTGALYAPANDPFVITVGAVDDKGTVSRNDDTMASFSSYGVTSDGFSKPDLVAPGVNIIALLASGGASLPKAHADHQVNNTSYFRMSGTSMAAPVVSGAVALLLQDEPNLTPDQVKYRLLATANKSWPGYSMQRAGAGYLDAYAAVQGTTTASANTGITMSRLLWANSGTAQTWDSAKWSTANWSSAKWSTANWSSANWGSDYWGP